jgi:hypothetical protein
MLSEYFTSKKFICALRPVNQIYLQGNILFRTYCINASFLSFKLECHDAFRNISTLLVRFTVSVQGMHMTEQNATPCIGTRFVSGHR